jgi:RNA polymerase sigma-70 factor (ECF subfamily)
LGFFESLSHFGDLNYRGELTAVNLTKIQRCGEARDLLARECLPFVRNRVYFRYGNHTDTEDVIQKALVVIFRDLEKLRDPNAFKSWMYRVISKVISAHYVERSHFARHFSLHPCVDEQVAAPESSPEKATAQARLLGRVRHHLQKLKHKKRTAVKLSLFFGYVDSEIGAIVGCSQETAKKRVQHGRRELLLAVRRDPMCRELFEEVAV